MRVYAEPVRMRVRHAQKGEIIVPAYCKTDALMQAGAIGIGAEDWDSCTVEVNNADVAALEGGQVCSA